MSQNKSKVQLIFIGKYQVKKKQDYLNADNNVLLWTTKIFSTKVRMGQDEANSGDIKCLQTMTEGSTLWIL